MDNVKIADIRFLHAITFGKGLDVATVLDSQLSVGQSTSAYNLFRAGLMTRKMLDETADVLYTARQSDYEHIIKYITNA